MCKEAKEIQELFECDFGDYVLDKDICFQGQGNIEICYGCFGSVKGLMCEVGHTFGKYNKQYYIKEVKKKFVWFPRQDQLQNLFDLKYVDSHYRLLREIREFSISEEGNNFSTLEQLWLAFVMKEKFNKVWNGSEWING